MGVRKKILVVDDSSSVREHLTSTLESNGFEVVSACDGVDALEKLHAEPEFALMFCDVNMPRMNGLELIAEVKRTAKLRSIPIVVLTTEGTPALVRRAKEAGAKAWIVKPFRTEHLVGVLQTFVS